MKIRVSRLESRMDHLTSLEDKVDRLETRVAVLTLESEKFLKFRNRRFLYLQNGQHDVLSKDSKIISRGNNVALGGDVLADVKLYERGIRFGYEVFTRLYGLPYTRIHFLKIERPIIALVNLTLIPEPESIVLQTLNMHSTVKLAPVEAAYSRFIREIQDAGYRSFTAMPNTPEIIAMEKFRNDYRELIKNNP